MDDSVKARPTVADMATQVEGWLQRSSEENQLQFTRSSEKELARYHHDLGQKIRNIFGLWEYPWEPELKDGVDCSSEHPDQISFEVIKKVWRRMKMSQPSRPQSLF